MLFMPVSHDPDSLQRIGQRLARRVAVSAERGQAERLRVADLAAGAVCRLPLLPGLVWECLVLSGDAVLDGQALGSLDYRREPATAAHVRVLSTGGARLLLRESRPAPGDLRRASHPAQLSSWEQGAGGIGRHLAPLGQQRQWRLALSPWRCRVGGRLDAGVVTGAITDVDGITMAKAFVRGQHVQRPVDDAWTDTDGTGVASRAGGQPFGAAMTQLPTAPAELAWPAAPVPQPALAATTERDSTEQAELAAWVARVVYQDEAALALLYRRLSSRVYRQALRLTRQAQTAEEVVEDVFWQIWRQAPRFDATRGVVLAWVTQITRSRALDALRAMGRDPLYEALEIDEMTSTAVSDHDDNPQDLLDRAQVTAQIHRAVATLDPLRRQLVALAFQRGYSQAEIADETGMPLGTVKSHLRRALATMKISLELAPRHGRLSP
jgi:RNA polymerase sigma-70 factor, ECF subfamily